MPRAAILTAPHTPLEIADVEVAPPAPGELKVRIAASGVCHSDLSVQNGTLPLAPPIVLGHEGAGIVEEIGDGVDGFAPGDRVVISWVPQCGECAMCSRAQGFLCDRAAATMGGTLLDGTTRVTRDGQPVFQFPSSGTFAEVAVVPAIAAVKIPDEVPLTSAALIGCAVLTGVGAAVNTASIRKGDAVAVIGCGGVGLNVVQGARIAGAERIVAVDTAALKLELARRFGATDVVNASSDDAVAAVTELTGGRCVDVAFEVIGLEATMQQALALTRRGGETVLVGVPRVDAMLSVPAALGLVLAAKTIKGCLYGSANVHRDIPMLVGLYRSGRLLLDELVSRTIPLDDVNGAFVAMEQGEVARSVIDFGVVS